MEWYWIVLIILGWFIGWTTTAIIICKSLEGPDRDVVILTVLLWPLLIPFAIVEAIVKKFC